MLCVGQECVQKKKKNLKNYYLQPRFETRLQENQRSGPWAAFLYKNAAKTFFKTRLQENQRLGPWAAFFIKMQPKQGLQPCFLQKRNYRSQLMGCENERLGPVAVCDKKHGYRSYLGCIFLENAAIGLSVQPCFWSHAAIGLTYSCVLNTAQIRSIAAFSTKMQLQVSTYGL